MIEGHDILCFSNDWGGDPLSKKHIITRLAKRNRVLWINSLGNRAPTATARDFKRMAKKFVEHVRGHRRMQENIDVFSPLALPFPGSALAGRVNQRYLAWSIRMVCHRLGFRRPISYSFLPSSADVVGSLGEKLVLYHCVDEFSEFTGSNKAGILDMERRLIERADAVIASSRMLYESKRPHNPNTVFLPHGVDVETFSRALDPRTEIPEDLVALPRPVIGFFGLIADWVDLDVVQFLARSRPQWSFVLIGKTEVDASALRRLPNVYFLGRKEYRDLPAYCKGFDVAILPFVVNHLTLAANPLKVREYLAAGLPVVATPLPEVQRLEPAVRTACTPEQFLQQTQELIASGCTGPQPAIARTMEGESWDAKVEEISRLISDLMAKGAAQPALAA